MADEDPLGGEDPTSISERAEAGENEQDNVEPPEPPMEVEGAAQLSMNLGSVVSNKNARKVEEASLRLLGGKRTIGNLLDIDTEYDLVVRVRPDAPKPLAKRDSNTGKTKAFDMDQTAQVLHIRQANAEAVRDLFADLLGRDANAAAKLLDELREFVTQDVAQAA